MEERLRLRAEVACGNMEELDALFQRRDAAEVKYMEDVAATADAYRKELEKQSLLFHGGKDSNTTLL